MNIVRKAMNLAGVEDKLNASEADGLDDQLLREEVRRELDEIAEQGTSKVSLDQAHRYRGLTTFCSLKVFANRLSNSLRRSWMLTCASSTQSCARMMERTCLLRTFH